MEQRSTEWHAARKGRITGSAVGAILGLSPFENRYAVMRRMVREYWGFDSERKDSPALDWGIANEAAARMDYTMETGNPVREAYFVTYEDWLGASPDGYIGNDGLLEIKCPYSLRDADRPEFKPIEAQSHYIAQMHIQMFVTGALWCDFFQWAPRGSKLQRVERDEAYIAGILAELREFYAEYLDIVADRQKSQPHLDALLPDVSTQSALQLVTEYLELADAEARAAERKREILDRLVEVTGHRNCTIGRYKLMKVEREGAVSYAKAVKELLPNADLSKWRGKPTSYWTVK